MSLVHWSGGGWALGAEQPANDQHAIGGGVERTVLIDVEVAGAVRRAGGKGGDDRESDVQQMGAGHVCSRSGLNSPV